MSSILPIHDSKYTIYPFGLYNTGSICWFNSLLQCLFSLTSLNKCMVELRNTFQKENKPLAYLYSSIITGRISTNHDKIVENVQNEHINDLNVNEHINDLNVNETSQITSPQSISLPILKMLIHTIKNNNDTSHLSFNQCSASEGFIMFIDMLKSDDIFNLFLNRFIHYIECTTCNKIVSEKEDESCQIELFDNYNPQNEIQFTKYILNHKSTIDTYTCDECKNTHTNLSKYSSVVMLHSIIVILFNRYNNNITKWFPQHIKIQKNNNKYLHYSLTASIEHTGTLNSGHYIAKAMRNNKYYKFNDETVTPIESITPTPNTYMIFYQLIADDVPN